MKVTVASWSAMAQSRSGDLVADCNVLTVSFSLAQFEQIARAGLSDLPSTVFQASEAGNGTVRSRPQDSDAIFQVFFSAKCGGTGVGYTTLGGGEGKRSILGKLPRGAFCQLLHNGDGAIIDVVVYHFAIIDLCGSAVGHFYRVDCIAYLVMIRGRDFFYIVGADRDVGKGNLASASEVAVAKAVVAHAGSV